MTKIDFLKIVRAHLATLRVCGKPRLSTADILFFYFLPLVLAGVVVFGFDKVLGRGSVDFLATIFSIFIGLLLNLLVLIVGVIPRRQENPVSLRTTLLKETFANISYAVLISVLLILTLFISKVTRGVALSVVSFAAFFIVGNFLLTLLMILKRVHSVFESGGTKQVSET